MPSDPPQPRSTAAARPEVAAAQRIVVKVGTRVITHDDGRIALARLFSIVDSVGRLRRGGREVLLVSSGAVGLGAEALGLEEIPTALSERQACAAVGQTRLVGLYQEGFSHLGLVGGQVLLTQSDFDERERYLNLRATLTEMLRRGVVPVINENDAVSTEELALVEGESRLIFGDNDRLSALVASKLDAQLLVLLTDVDGLFDQDPRSAEQVRLISRVEALDRVEVSGWKPGSPAGRGGMRSKVEAALIAARSGCHAVIASGRQPGALDRALSGDDVGTWFPAGEALPARERWIAYAAAPRGTLYLDPGAVEALRLRGASLLPSGVTRIEGDFQPGDVVELRAAGGDLIGRGVVRCSAAAARAWCSGNPPAGFRAGHALIRRNRMVLERP